MAVEIIGPKILKKKDLAVVVDTYCEDGPAIKHFIERIIKVAKQEGKEAQIVPVIHKVVDSKTYRSVLSTIKTSFPNQANAVVVDQLTYAYAYLSGLSYASRIADLVIEIDSGGSHQPEEIPGFLNGLKEYDIVFSSRFINGAENKYPWQRRLTSWTATKLSNVFLDTKLSDAASGFEAFRGVVLQDLFKAVPPEEWLAATKGPMHMIQTEMRAMLSWQDKYKYTSVPISYGKERVGGPLPIPYLAKALLCLYYICRSRHERENRIKKIFIP